MTTFIIFSILACMYFLPWLIAKHRGKANSAAIGILNLTLGFTGIGWLAALIWAFTVD